MNRSDSKRQIIFICIIFSVLVSCEAIFAQTIVRGPYLQTGTPTSIIIKWRTDLITDSRVQYGFSPDNLSFTVGDTSMTTEHEMTLTGLNADTQYFYSIGSSVTTLAGADSNFYFITHPLPGRSKPTRIWILGDSGTKNNNARAVRDAYYQFTQDRDTDLWLMLGDNAYSSGTDAEYQAAVFDMYPQMLRKSVLWATLGNHDRRTLSTPGPYPYYEIFTLPKNGEAGGLPSGAEAYYSFDYGNIHFICLNSATSSLRKPQSPMWVWLAEDLASNDKDWTIAFWHHPPYSKGTHDSDVSKQSIMMRQLALPILEEGGVDLVLSGHSHTYERSFLIDGHYGFSDSLTSDMIIDGGNGREDGDGAFQKATVGTTPHEGAVYVVTGCSGQSGGGSLDHPVMIMSLQTLGSLVLDIDMNRLDASFINQDGSVQDYFTIKKGLDVLPQPEMVLYPLSLDFGEVTLDSSASQTFLVKNNGLGDLLVSSLALSGTHAAEFHVDSLTVPFTLSTGDSQAVVVNFAPVSSGSKQANLRIASNDPNQNPFDLNLSGVGVQLFPELVLSSNSFDFGEVAVDSSASQTFLVKNNGLGDL
ncbi:MAG: choice-of-anchor D domain-containing protein, partial [bacterium]